MIGGMAAVLLDAVAGNADLSRLVASPLVLPAKKADEFLESSGCK